MSEQHPIPEQRLFDYYDGRLGESERNEVKSWIEASEENRRTARCIYSLLLATDTNRMRQITNTEEALRKVKGRKIVQRRKVAWWQWAQRAAAVLFLPLALLAAWQHSLLDGREPVAGLLEVRTNPGTTTCLTLPDSTRVWLNSSTVLSYPSRFGDGTRDVRLSGEAYFEVSKDPARRFVVHTPQESAIEVYGTSFNVEAYADAPYITTTLTEGKVGFRYRHGMDTRRADLAPGEKLVYDVAARDVSLHKTNGLSESCWKDGLIIFDNTPLREVSLHKTNGLSESCWKDGLIIFDNTPLREALHMLGKRFDVDFTVTNPKLDNDRFTGTFGTQRLERILQYFEISSHIHWRYADDPAPGQGRANIEIY